MDVARSVKAKLPLAVTLVALGAGILRRYPDWDIVGILSIVVGVSLGLAVVFEAVDYFDRTIRELRQTVREQGKAIDSLENNRLRK